MLELQDIGGISAWTLKRGVRESLRTFYKDAIKE